MRLVAMMAVTSCLFGIVPGAAAERMPAGEIGRTFSGMTLDGVYASGLFFTETYHEDQSIRYWDTNAADSGRWFVRNGQLCTFYRNQQGACFIVDRDGDNCFTFYEPSPDDATVPLPDWTSRGWDRRKSATCPTPPEAAI